jgi:hypothetical protein
MSITKDRHEESTKVWLALGIVVFCSAGAFFGAWPEFSDIQESPWTASGLYFVITAGSCLLTAGLGLVLFLSCRQRLKGEFIRFLYGSVVLSGLLCAVLLVTYLNVKLDTSKAEPVEIRVRDMFVVTVARRDSTQTHEYYYLGLSVPEGLRNYSLLVLPDNTFADFAVGRRFWVDRHGGLFRLPWYQFHRHFGWGKNQDLATLNRKLTIRSVRGTLADDSPYRKELAGYGIPLPEK